MTDWKNRIVRYGVQPADQFTPNPKNPRKHPDKQRQAVTGSLDSVGILAPVVINVRTGRMIDGHLRVDLALANGNAELPFVEVDLSEEEEALALATFDFTTVMAEYDPAMLDSLLEGVHTDNAALQSMIAELAGGAGLYADDGGPGPLGANDFEYQEKFGVLVECVDASEQEAVYNELLERGLKVKVLVV